MPQTSARTTARGVALLLVVLVVLGASAALAQGKPPAPPPQLVIETGGHSAPVWRIAADREGRRIVSISPDKTARVWNVASGALERVLRVPISAGAGGRLWALAMSPDGSRVAVAGNALALAKSPLIYVFDVASGEMVRSLPANSTRGVVAELAWSRDGRFLASGQSVGGGLRIYRTADWTSIAADVQPGASIRGLEFDAEAHLIAGAADGILRRYRVDANGVQLLASAHMAEKRIDRIKLSPDGARVAIVAGEGAYDVHVLDASTLETQRSLSLPAAERKRGDLGGLRALAWSDDARKLMVAGQCCAPINPHARALGAAATLIVGWDDGAKAPATAIPVPPFNVTDLVALPGNRMAYASSEPGIGIVEADQRVRALSAGSLIDFRGSATGFAVSDDARAVRFSYERYHAAPVVHDFEQLGQSMAAAQADASRLKAAVLSAQGIGLNEWWRAPLRPPELDGKPLTEGPLGRSVSFAPDRASFAFALTSGVRLYDASGKQRWRYDTGTVMRSVVVSGDGRFVVAAGDDGMIRWHRHADGALLLTLFTHADRRRWVAWTPQGYFAASAGGEALFGWHVNRGLERAGEFYPAARFFDERFRPDLLLEVLKSAQTDRQVLARLKINQKVDLAEGFKPPPRVEVLAPASGQVFEEPEIAFRLALEDLGGGVGELRVFHNGRALALGPLEKRSAIERRLALVNGDNVFVVSALSAEGVESEPVTVKVVRRAPPVAPAIHALVVGINRYKNPALNLNYAEKDAQAIAAFFADAPLRKLYREAHVRTLLNEQATAANIRQALDRLAASAAKEDTVVLYFAGHGETAGEEWYFVPHEVTEPESDTVLARSGISRQFLQDLLKKLPAQKVLVLLDACKSGAAATAARSIVDRKAIMNLARATGTYIVAASGGDQLAIEVSKLGHGVFTWTLLEGLRGRAGEKRVTAESLIAYVKSAMPETAEKFRGRPQFPVSWGGGSDFALVVRE